MHHATCTMLLSLHHATCDMHLSLHHASYPLHHAPCTFPHPCHLRVTVMSSFNTLMVTQICVVHNSLVTQDGRQDPARTPRRRNYRDKDHSGRFASGSGRHHNASRSRSPTRRTPACQRSPPQYSRYSSNQQSPSKNASFPASTASQGLPVCALCLATDTHDTRKCRSETLWDGSKARCRKTDEGKLITPAGTTLCNDWNTRRGCTTNMHEHRHECSGCGNKDHGAQKCPQAQRKPSSHAI
jgi:hypothetical protein